MGLQKLDACLILGRLPKLVFAGYQLHNPWHAAAQVADYTHLPAAMLEAAAVSTNPTSLPACSAPTSRPINTAKRGPPLSPSEAEAVPHHHSQASTLVSVEEVSTPWAKTATMASVALLMVPSGPLRMTTPLTTEESETPAPTILHTRTLSTSKLAALGGQTAMQASAMRGHSTPPYACCLLHTDPRNRLATCSTPHTVWAAVQAGARDAQRAPLLADRAL